MVFFATLVGHFGKGIGVWEELSEDVLGGGRLALNSRALCKSNEPSSRHQGASSVHLGLLLLNNDEHHVALEPQQDTLRLVISETKT